MKWLWAFGVACVGIFAGCEENFSGGSSEHENVVQAQGEFVPVKVTDCRGKPLAHRTVDIVERERWATLLEFGEDVLLDSSLKTDDEGNVFVESGLCAHVALVVEDGPALGYAPCAQPGRFSRVKVGRAKLLSGKTAPNRLVALYGTASIASSDSLGLWRLRASAEMGPRDVFERIDGFWMPVENPSGRFLVEDFSESSGRPFLSRFREDSHWWTAFDTDSLRDSTRNFSQHRIWLGGERGFALHIALVPTENIADSKAMIGLDLGGWTDLSAADSLAFMAMGAGSLGVQLVCQSADSIKTAAFEYQIELDSSWTERVLPIPEFYKVYGKNLDSLRTWDEAGRSCKSIAFFAKGPVDLWLDDISIGGVHLSDFER